MALVGFLIFSYRKLNYESTILLLYFASIYVTSILKKVEPIPFRLACAASFFVSNIYFAYKLIWLVKEHLLNI